MSAEKRNALGRGLSALLNDSENVYTNKSSVAQGSEVASLGSVNDIKLSEIEVNPFQPRTDIRHRLMHLPAQLLLDGMEFCPHSLYQCASPDHKVAFRVRAMLARPYRFRQL